MAQFIRVLWQITRPQSSRRCQLCQSARYLSDSSDFLIDEHIPARKKRRLEKRNLTVNDLDPSNSNPGIDARPPNIASDRERELQNELESSFVDTNKDVEFPSDKDHVRNVVRRQEKETKKIKMDRVTTDPRSTSVVLFPGQGSQYVGMGKSLLKYPGVSDLYGSASEFLGYDLLSLCLTGPKEKLDMTQYCQPAIFVSSLAGLERLKEENPSAVENCVATAGYSIGEYAALVFIGAITFETGLELVASRARLMQEASEAVAGGMLSVYVSKETKIRTAMVAAKEYCRSKLRMDEPVCKVANYATTNIQVIAGHEEALDFIQHFGREWGIKRAKRLPVSGAFHTELMKLGGGFGQFKNLVMRTNFDPPRFPIYSNVTGKKMIPLTPKIRTLLLQQITKPVLWEQTMHCIYKRDSGVEFPATYEVGPGKQMGVLLKSCNGKAYNNYYSITA